MKIFFGLQLSALCMGSILSGALFAGDIIVKDGWSRASAGMARAGAAFVTIENHSSEADRLIGAQADSLTTMAQLHNHVKKADGAMHMTQIKSVTIPANSSVQLKPGGQHIMFMQLKAPLQEGSTFPLTLTFEKAGKLDLTVAVKGPGAMGNMHNMNHGGSQQPGMQQQDMSHQSMKHAQ